jgi:hypothetical protein
MFYQRITAFGQIFNCAYTSITAKLDSHYCYTESVLSPPPSKYTFSPIKIFSFKKSIAIYIKYNKIDRYHFCRNKGDNYQVRSAKNTKTNQFPKENEMNLSLTCLASK